MFPVRHILLVFATTLICNDSLGGDTNDRIDQVLAVMVKMNDKVDVLTKKVNGMEETVQTISKMEDKLEDKVDGVTKQVGDIKKQMDSGISDVKNEISVIDKKVEKVDSDVIRHNSWDFVFVGRGYEVSHDEEVSKDDTTMKECLKWCQTKRMKDGVEWNGVVWEVYDGKCHCEKNDRGHREVRDYLHFKVL